VSNLNAYRDGMRVLRTILAEQRYGISRRAVNQGAIAAGALGFTRNGAEEPSAWQAGPVAEQWPAVERLAGGTAK
jgi:hypothetical protein